MDVLDRYLLLPAELQWMIYKMLPCRIQRAMNEENPYVLLQGHLPKCAELGHVECFDYCLKTEERKCIYACVVNFQLINRAIKNCRIDVLWWLRDFVSCFVSCDHGLECWSAAYDISRLPDTTEARQVIKYIQLPHNKWLFKEVHRILVLYPSREFALGGLTPLMSL